MKRRPPACVLTIAGSDSGGGAGVQADARTIHALGGFACMAITAITAQNTRGVQRWRPEPPAMIAAQIEAVLGPGVGPGFLSSPNLRRPGRTLVLPAKWPKLGRTAQRTGAGLARPMQSAMAGDGGVVLHQSGALPVRAIKTGLIPGAAGVRAIARALEVHRDLPLVVDPVIGSTSGTLFLDRAGVVVLRRELLPYATLVTPNWPEAEALSGIRLHSFTDAERAARAIVDESHCAVLLKGGHAPGSICRDCLVMPDGQVHWFESARIDTPNTHGTGCVLAAAVATELAKGNALEAAVAVARAFLQRSLRAHRQVPWGGAGPAFAG